jgi:hypothetical protein
LEASSFAPDLGAGLAALVAAIAREGKKEQDASSQQSFEPALALWPSPGGGLPCRPIRAKFRPIALPAGAGAAILHLVTEK